MDKIDKKIKIAKGYRLYPKTHDKISKIKKLLNSNNDKEIYNACMFYLKHLQNSNQSKKLI
jgi:hypothetical protein